MADYSGRNFVSTQRHDTYPAIDPAKADLDGKVVLVTGASKGIGKVIALAIAQSGAKGLVLFARSDLSDVKAACLAVQRPGQPLGVLTVSADIANNDQVIAGVKKADETFGRLDVVINNAGYAPLSNSISESDPQDWMTAWNINILGTYHVVRATLPLILKSDGDKTIINLSSVGAQMIFPGWSAYQTSKLAISRFTEFINVEYGGKGVLAYSINPGAVLTDMPMNSGIPEEWKSHFIDTPELSAHTILWLLKERRDWLAGRYLDCNWDVEEVLKKKEEIVEGDKLKPKLVV